MNRSRMRIELKCMEKIVIDTSALFEYFFATEKGAIVQKFVDDSNAAILIPVLVLGEFTSKLSRRGIDSTKLVTFLESISTFIELDATCAVKAGLKHAGLRKVEPDVSLTDCIVIQVAEDHGNALILTTDSAFKHYKNVELL